MSTTKTFRVYKNDTFSYTISKTGYKTIDESLGPINQNTSINEEMDAIYTITIVPNPSDANVVLTSTGCTQVGNSIQVLEGASVQYTVSKSGYTTVSNTIEVYSNDTIYVELQEKTEEIDVSDYNYELNGYDLTLTEYTGNSTSIVSPNI